jgi:pimeloyl-ACP methyl ester carboxylesterase
MAYRRGVLVAVAVGLLGACAGGAAPSSAPTPSPGPTASPSSEPASASAGSGLVDIGGGRTLYVACSGSGSPTILLESGDESDLNQWRRVRPSLADSTRTCAYDRLGIGPSSPAEGCRQLDDLNADLEAALGAAGIVGPFVLVGASGGGFLQVGFAARHPDQVRGMVFVETPKALTAERYPDVLPRIACDAPDNIERRDYLAIEHAAWDDRTVLGSFPVTVISNDYGDAAPPDSDEATNVEDQRGWFDLTDGTTRQVVVESGHDVAENEPELVIDEILMVLALASTP